MIRSFKTREAEMIFSRRKSARIPEEVQRQALRELRALDQTTLCRDVWLPFDENGSGAPARYAIPIDSDWRICFEWREGDAYDVEIVKIFDGAAPTK
jgi:proteic killer suppression protein